MRTKPIKNIYVFKTEMKADHLIFRRLTRARKIQVLLILTVYSNKDNAVYPRLKSEINGVDNGMGAPIPKAPIVRHSPLETGQRFVLNIETSRPYQSSR